VGYFKRLVTDIDEEDKNKIIEQFSKLNYKEYYQNQAQLEVPAQDKSENKVKNNDQKFIESLKDNFFKEVLLYEYSIIEKSHLSLEKAILKAAFLNSKKNKIHGLAVKAMNTHRFSFIGTTMKFFAGFNLFFLFAFMIGSSGGNITWNSAKMLLPAALISLVGAYPIAEHLRPKNHAII
jgi:hypothetical protein